MRISDWSSDVCSSDLTTAYTIASNPVNNKKTVGVVIEVETMQPNLAERRSKSWAPYIDAKLGFRNHWYPVLLGSEVGEGSPGPVKLLGEQMLLNRVEGQLGGASCRERVGQYG